MSFIAEESLLVFEASLLSFSAGSKAATSSFTGGGDSSLPLYPDPVRDYDNLILLMLLVILLSYLVSLSLSYCSS